jgi:ABC-type transport system substrate-binding protein
MKLSGLLSTAVPDLCLCVCLSLGLAARASTRPHYGGTLRIAMREAPASLDPSSGQPGTAELMRLIFDTLTTMDAHGRVQPALALSWRSDPGDRRWQFTVRGGATFQDGTSVGSDAVAASLRSANPSWKVFAAGETVVIECDAATQNLPAILALPRYSIAKRSSGKLSGSGPFAISNWDPGKKINLTARDDYWAGRAFVDAVEVQLGVSFHDQMLALDLNKADIVQVAPDQVRHLAGEGRHLANSAPSEWMALVFARDSQSAEETRRRKALGLSIDRPAMNNVFLQGGGEPAGGFLPNWVTGYAFLFPATVDLQSARRLLADVRPLTAWTVSYDVSDAMARVIAERIALNAHDAGLTIQTSNSTVPDMRVVRLPLPSLNAEVALRELASALSLPQPKFGGDASSLYSAESVLLQTQRVIPLLHLRKATGLSRSVRGWEDYPDGSWHLQNVWLEIGAP